MFQRSVTAMLTPTIVWVAGGLSSMTWSNAAFNLAQSPEQAAAGTSASASPMPKQVTSPRNPTQLCFIASDCAAKPRGLHTESLSGKIQGSWTCN